MCAGRSKASAGKYSIYSLTLLAPSDIQAMEARLLERGKSARSVQHVHAVLREALKHAMRWGLTHRNVAEGVDPPKPHRPEIQPPSAEGVWEILGLAERRHTAPCCSSWTSLGVGAEKLWAYGGPMWTWRTAPLP